MATKYTKEHEWLNVDGAIATVGITQHAQDALGDVVFVDLPEVGKSFSANDIAGVGFVTADRIAKAVGIKHDDPRRAEAAVRHLVLEGGDSGHTGLPKEVLNEGAASLQIPIALMDAAVERLIETGVVIRDQELAYHPALFQAESYIAKNDLLHIFYHFY